MVSPEKYRILYEEVKKLGIEDEELIDKLIEQVDELSDTLIDIYLKSKEDEKESNNILQSINKGASRRRRKPKSARKTL